MNVLIYKSLLKSLGDLSGSEVKRTTEFMLKFQDNPTQPGVSLERVTKAKSDNLWSARISRDLRAVIYKEGDTWALLHAGHHDDAYNWAQNRKVELNNKTGALQIVEVTESAEAILSDRQFWQANQIGLFDSHEDDYLLSLGLPPSWLPVTRKLLTEEDLLKIIEKLPEEVSERLLQVALGELVTPPLPKINASPLENEDTQRRFVTVKSQAELEKILKAPLATWIGFLHPSQKRLATGNFNGPVKVTGSAGTGKTVVALHRARHLARKGKRVLLTTFVTTLCDNLTRNLKLLCTEAELDNIVVATVAKQAGDILKQAGQRYEIINDEEIKDLIDSFSSDSCPLTGLELWQEWQFVIQPNGVSHWDEYRSVSRSGRGKGLGVRDRKNVWQIFEQVLHSLDTQHKLDWSHYFRRATIAIESGRLDSPFDAVIVDEVQDLRPQELKFLSALAGRKGEEFMMVGDGNQRIYQGRFSFKSLGINIQGRSNILKVNYRTTEQIRRFADNLIAISSDDLNGGQESRKGTISLLQGPHPILQGFSGPEEEAKFVTAEVQKLTARGLHADEIGIFARTKYLFKDLKTHLTAAGIPVVLLDNQSAGSAKAVHVGSMHRSKGLEFKAVFAIQVSAQNLPLTQAVNAETDKRAKQESIERERHLLYVTATRARDFTYISWSGQPSRFIEDMSEKSQFNN
ncbi:MAG: DNA helicase UvrD [Phormidesmis priestleyi]|uniref:DNA 3'-5' helicase n=1 Tax=Phormidesmis priestleyi TaxID=268141 RepID=A0A2W4WT71_9CYAN|nr:MAG: DNA helicase UvrD [Phormidesmis priestleyi]